MVGLINERRLWGSLRRMFDGSVSELLAELLQNSQRATAGVPPDRRAVDITIPPRGDGPHTITYRDRGHGIAGVEGLRVLLTVAESAFAAPSVARDQHPPGLGFYSLVAREGVSGVELRSGTLAFPLDTARWWADEAYRESWRERIATLPAGEAVDGVELRIACDEATRAAFAAALPTGALSAYCSIGGASLRAWPAVGYAGVLAVRVNGTPALIETPHELSLPEAEIVAEYRGCPVRLAFGDEPGTLTGNWFGQSIVERSGGPWNAYVIVRAGRPLTPRAPTRAGLIDDAARRAFVAWVEERLFAYVASADRAALRPAQLTALARVDRERLDRECRYAVVRRIRPFDDGWIGSAEDVDRHDLEVVERAALLDPAAPHLLVEGEVRLAHRVADAASAERFRRHARERGWWAEGGEYGISSFVRALGRPILTPVLGVATDRHLWWRPDLDPAEPDRWLVAGPGTWGIGRYDEPPAEWSTFPSKAAPLVVFGADESYDVDAVDWTVATPDPVAFLQIWGRAPWRPDEDDADASERAYDESVTELLRRLLGDAVPPLALGAIAGHFRQDEGRVVRLDLVYDHDAPASAWPIAVVAITDRRRRKRFHFYA